MIQKFEFCNTDFEGAYLIKPFCATDIRGAFIKDYSKEVFEANGLEHNIAKTFFPILLLLFAAVVKIGRASCRERV